MLSTPIQISLPSRLSGCGSGSGFLLKWEIIGFEFYTLKHTMNGIIKTIYISTVGGVIQPGEVLADLVSLDDQSVVEVELLTFDVGYVSVGQRAKLKLSSSSLQKFGSIGGTILNISPDKFLRKSDSMPFFKVRIKPDKEAYSIHQIEFWIK